MSVKNKKKNKSQQTVKKTLFFPTIQWLLFNYSLRMDERVRYMNAVFVEKKNVAMSRSVNLGESLSHEIRMVRSLMGLICRYLGRMKFQLKDGL